MVFSAYIIARMSRNLHLDMLALAVRLAHDARAIALAGRGDLQTEMKPDESVVTQADHAIQRMILAEIAKQYPDHAIAAEECVAEPGCHASRAAARYCWAVDPLDGTRNYVAGLPCFATSIGVLDEGRPVAAAVYDHQLDWTFAATLGGGATLNGRPIRVRDATIGREKLVAISSSKSRFAVAVVREWSATKGLVLRNLGSTALHLALVASGGFDAALCTRCKIWDIAAGALLVTEAGGWLTDPRGGDPFPFRPTDDASADRPVLAAGAGLHEELRRSIGKAAGGDK